MHNGFIKIHRKMINWEWYDDINTKVLFIHLLIKTNHKDKNWRGVEIKRGEVLTGRTELAKQTGLTEQQVRTSLNKLKSTSEITIKSTNRFSLIKVNNYNDYQQINQPEPSKQPTSNQQATTTKNTKNLKNEEESKKKKYLEFVFLSEEELLKLKEKISPAEINELVKDLNNYIGSTGKKYKSHYHTILTWNRKREKERPEGVSNNGNVKYPVYQEPN